MKPKASSKLVLVSLMSAIAMGIYALESLIPPIVPIPGVKLGLANVVTLVAIYLLGSKSAFFVLFIRILLTSLLFGHPVSFVFSLCGGLLSFAVMAVLKRFMEPYNIWAISVFAAFAHNFGQVAAAVVITQELAVAYYFLFLVISSVVTGVFTGICAQTSIKKLKLLKVFN